MSAHAHTWAQAETWPDVGAHLGPCAAMPAHHVPSCERLNTRPGLGAHVCLGMHLARLESTKIFNALFDELPGLRLDPDAPAPYITGTMFRSPSRLDVVWD